MSRRGIDVSQFQDDASAYDYLAGQASLASDPRLQQLAQLGQEVLPQYEQFQEFVKGQEEAAKPPPEEDPPFFDPIPEWNAEDERMLWTNPETGQIEVHPNFRQSAHPTLAQRYQDHQRVKRTNLEKLLRDPYGAVQKQVEEAVQKQLGTWQEQQKTQTQGYAEQQQAEQLDNALLADQNNGLLEFDEKGQPKVDPRGQLVFTPKGQAYAQYRDHLIKSANVPMQQAPVLAMQMILGYQPPQPQTPPQSSPQNAAQEQFLEPGYMGDRGGSLGAAEQPGGPAQNPNLDFEQLYEQEAAKGG